MINVRRYIIDYNKFAIERIPEDVRVPEVIQYVLCLLVPVVWVYDRVIAFRLYINYTLTITPQVVFIEMMLNNRYDTLLRRIYLRDGIELDVGYFYTRTEAKPNYFYARSEVAMPKRYIYARGESGARTYDFIVFVPLAILSNIEEMKSIIDAYKLAGKYYLIQPF